MIWAAVVLGAYLLGSVSSSYLVVWVLRGQDVRTLGSGNAGATNVLRTVGPLPAAVVLVLDVAKGAAAVAAARWLGAPGPVIGAAAVAAVAGHVFPLYLGLRGGKGVATMAGAMGSLAPAPATGAAVVFLVVVGSTRYVALGSISGAGTFPLLIYLGSRIGWWAPAPIWLLASSALVALLIVFKHADNLERLRAGTEWRLGDSRDQQVVG